MFAKIINNERGIALVVALSIMVLMTLLATAALYQSTLELKISGNEKAGLKAYYIALAGMRDAEKRLMSGTADTRGYANYALTDYTTVGWSRNISGNMPTDGSYSVTVSHLKIPAGNDVVIGGSGLPSYRITSNGTYGESQRQLEKIISLEVMDLWNKAVTACGDMMIDSNSSTDSYDSDVGEYDPASPGTQGDIYTSGDVLLKSQTEFNGNITTTGSITLDGNSIMSGIAKANGNIALSGNNNTITGRAESGADIIVSNSGEITGDADAGGTITNNGTISGTSTQGATVTSVTVPPACEPDNIIPPPDGIETGNSNGTGSGDDGIVCANTNPNKCGADCFTGDGMCDFTTDVTLSGSNDPSNPTLYYFKGLTLGSNAEMSTTGYVEIFVEGDFKMDSNNIIAGQDYSGDINNPGNPKPAEVLVHVYGSSNANPGIGATASMESNTALYGKLYAPEASMTSINSNAQVYGSVLAGGLCQSCGGGLDSNAGVSWDAALETAATDKVASGVNVKLFRECYYGTYASDPGTEYAIGSCKPQ